MILAVTFPVSEPEGKIIREVIGDASEIRYLSNVGRVERQDVLRRADVLLARNTGNELRPEELPLIRNAKLVQFLSAGLDYIRLSELPVDVPIAKNAGAYSEPMAEHALAMALAAAKRLFIEHGNLRRGEFNQFTPNKMLNGRICGIFGFGGIGRATARLMHSMGMRIHAINRSGKTDDVVQWIGTPDHLSELLAAADVFVISVPLTRATEGAIRRRELAAMKSDAILINLARGEIIDESALYEHLKANPHFTACLDAWWIEPVRHGEFRTHLPFLELPNVIGSPHNSASVAGAYDAALRCAVENCRRVLDGEAPLHLITAEERVK